MAKRMKVLGCCSAQMVADALAEGPSPGQAGHDSAGAPHVPPLPTRWDRVRPIAMPVAVAVAGKVAMLLMAFVMLDRPEDFWERMATRWDGEHYLLIAREGYQENFQGPGDSVAFAFGYPMLIRLFGGSEVAALAINNVASLAGIAVLAWHWGPRPAMAVALFPPLLVFGTVAYSEGLYLLVAALGLALVERGRQAWGGLAAGLAAMTRYMGGPALLLGMVPWREWRHPRQWLAFVLVAVAGLAIFVFQWQMTGEFFAYYEAQRPWGAELVWPWQHFDWLLHGWFTLQGGPIQGGNLSPLDFVVRDILFSIPVVAGIVLLFRRPGALPSAVYTLVVYTTALCTIGTPAVSLPRFLVAAFPAIAILGDHVRQRGVWMAYVVGAVAVAANGLAHHLFRYWS